MFVSVPIAYISRSFWKATEGRMMPAQMPQKTQAWLEAKALEIARREMGCRELAAVRIKRILPEGSGPNWQVAAFEPPLPPAAETFALEAIALLRGTYALTPPETDDQEALKQEYKRLLGKRATFRDIVIREQASWDGQEPKPEAMAEAERQRDDVDIELARIADRIRPR
ncbi:MAG: hypothetical protein K2Y27_15485 [Xanthobacteraceae bacterium]|nr:hypothetical protein [Xanthobacteraceae bacterium]